MVAHCGCSEYCRVWVTNFSQLEEEMRRCRGKGYKSLAPRHELLHLTVGTLN